MATHRTRLKWELLGAGWAAVGAALVMGVPPSERVEAQGPVPTRRAKEPTVLRPKVLVVTFDPIIEVEGGRRLSQVCRWNDPMALTRGYMNDLRADSGGLVQYRVVERVTVDAFPVKKDGFRYTDESYLACWRARKGWHEPDAVDYPALIRDFRLAQRVEASEIDEVWFWSMPYSGFWESTMAGKGAYFCNSDPVPDVPCSRIFIIMGFNYERGVGEMPGTRAKRG